MDRSLKLGRADRSTSRWTIIPLLALPLYFSILFPDAARAQTRDRDTTAPTDHLCQEEKIPLKLKAGISLARLEVNGKPMTFIVDSAGTSVINSDHVTLRVVRQLRTAPVTLSQNAPLDSWDVVQIESLRLGAEEIRDLKILSRSLPQLEKQLGSEVDGILGADLLTRWDAVALDYRHGAMRLGRTSCAVQPQDSFLPPPPRMSGLTRRP